MLYDLDFSLRILPWDSSTWTTTIWDIFCLFTFSKHPKQAKIQDERFHETSLRWWDGINWTSSYDWITCFLIFVQGDLFFCLRGICRDCWSDKKPDFPTSGGDFYWTGLRDLFMLTHALLGKSLASSLIPLAAWKFVCSCKCSPLNMGQAIRPWLAVPTRHLRPTQCSALKVKPLAGDPGLAIVWFMSGFHRRHGWHRQRGDVGCYGSDVHGSSQL